MQALNQRGEQAEGATPQPPTPSKEAWGQFSHQLLEARNQSGPSLKASEFCRPGKFPEVKSSSGLSLKKKEKGKKPTPGCDCH